MIVHVGLPTSFTSACAGATTQPPRVPLALAFPSDLRCRSPDKFSNGGMNALVTQGIRPLCPVSKAASTPEGAALLATFQEEQAETARVAKAFADAMIGNSAGR